MLVSTSTSSPRNCDLIGKGCGLGSRVFKKPSGDSQLVTAELSGSTSVLQYGKNVPEAHEPNLAWHLAECRYRYVQL